MFVVVVSTQVSKMQAAAGLSDSDNDGAGLFD